MFGYFKLDKSCSSSIADAYKKYYCLLCHALEAHYGLPARFLLSYDVTLFMLLLGDCPELEEMGRVPCLYSNAPLKKLCQMEQVKACAALDLLLAAKKIEDDLLDEGSGKARLALFLCSHMFSKAKKDYPEMWDIIQSRYDSIRKLEQDCRLLPEFERAFSGMMTDLAWNCFGLTDQKRLQILQLASKWLYFIDAVDDMDDNIRDGSFNPFRKYDSFHRLKNKYYMDLAQHYRSLFEGVDMLEPNGSASIINRVVFYGIPEETIRVLSGQGKLF